MIVNDEYRFPVSISDESLKDKTISNAMIASIKDDEVKEIRKKYGFNKGISFREVEVNPKTLLESLLEGKVFCHLFRPENYRKDGSFGSSEKTNKNFSGSYVIGVDIDKTSYSSAGEYLEQVEMKPTFYYSSYSNNQEGKGARFRLIYVFDQIIENPYYFRYCAKMLNQYLEMETKELIDDDCNLRCSQYFNGTYRNAEGINLEYGISNQIYSLSDFGINKTGYKYFLLDGAGYKTLSIDRKKDLKMIQNDLECKELNQNIESKVDPEIIDQEPIIDPELIKDMKFLSYDDFMKKNRRKYNYIYRTEGEYIDGVYRKAGEKDFSLFWNVSKVKDGNKRRKKLFERICLRRVINPEISPEDLLFCAYEDRYRFFEIDKDLDIDCLVRNVESALNLEIPEIEKMYSENLKYLRSRMKGIVLKPGLVDNVEDRNELLKQIRWNKIGEFYNKNISVDQNLEILRENGIQCCRRTLFYYSKIKGFKNILSDQEVKEYLDPDKSVRENCRELKDQDIKVAYSRVQKLLKEIRNEVL